MASIEKSLGGLAERINAEHRACETAVNSALTHAMNAGGMLDEAKASLPHGAFGPWLKENFAGSDRTARAYMRVYSHREELEAKRQSSATLSLDGALKALSAPKDEPPDPETASLAELEASAEAAYERAKQEETSRIKIALEEEGEVRSRLERQLAEEAALREKERKAAERQIARLERERERERAEFSQTVETNAQKQIADYQARYAIPEIPEIFQVEPEAFQKLLRESTDDRQREAMRLLNEAMKLVGKMMSYEPVEAANGFLRWHDRDRAKEAIVRYTKWLTRCKDEIEAQTTPGRLRVLEDGGKKDKRG